MSAEQSQNIKPPYSMLTQAARSYLALRSEAVILGIPALNIPFVNLVKLVS